MMINVSLVDPYQTSILVVMIDVMRCDDRCPSNYLAPDVKLAVAISSKHDVGLKTYTYS